MILILWPVALLSLSVQLTHSQDLINIQLFHSIGEGECQDVSERLEMHPNRMHMNADEFSARGRIIINTKEAVSNDPVTLTDDEVIHLKEAANDTNRLYYVKSVTSTATALAFTRACAIVESSSFAHILNVYLDIKGQFIGIGVTSTNPTCSPVQATNGANNRKKMILTTTVNVVQTVAGPQPDTQSYIQRMEQEKLEQMKGDRGDNRSFLAKYVSTSLRVIPVHDRCIFFFGQWIYIVPLVIFMMITSASNPEAGGQ